MTSTPKAGASHGRRGADVRRVALTAARRPKGAGLARCTQFVLKLQKPPTPTADVPAAAPVESAPPRIKLRVTFPAATSLDRPEAGPVKQEVVEEVPAPVDGAATDRGADEDVDEDGRDDDDDDDAFMVRGVRIVLRLSACCRLIRIQAIVARYAQFWSHSSQWT